MNIYYIRYRDDNPQEDGIWLLTNESQFFLSREGAERALAERHDTEWARWVIQRDRAQAQWEKVEAAWLAVEEAGIDPKSAFPYHKREFTYPPCKENFVVDSLEVLP